MNSILGKCISSKTVSTWGVYKQFSKYASIEDVSFTFINYFMIPFNPTRLNSDSGSRHTSNPMLWMFMLTISPSTLFWSRFTAHRRYGESADEFLHRFAFPTRFLIEILLATQAFILSAGFVRYWTSPNRISCRTAFECTLSWKLSATLACT